MREVFRRFRTSKPKFLIIIILVVPLFIIVGIILLWILGSFFFNYNYYVHKDINKIKYAEPTEEAKNFDIEEYINSLPPVEYTKIDYPVGETLTYEFNGYVLTMDIPEGFSHHRIPRDEKYNKVKSSLFEIPKIRDSRREGKGTLRGVVSDDELCIKNAISKDEKCDLLITPIKSSHKKISMKDIYIYGINNHAHYKHISSKFHFLCTTDIISDDFIFYRKIFLLLSDQQKIAIKKNDDLSQDIFLSIMDTLKIEKKL